jgi:hypothetical protein
MQVKTPAITDTNAPNVLIVASISGSIETKNPLLDITVPTMPFKVVLLFILLWPNNYIQRVWVWSHD